MVASAALLRGLAVLSITSFDRSSGCWGGDDLPEIGTTIATWMQQVGLPASLPRVGLGASSGGGIVFRASRPAVLSAIASYIAAGPALADGGRNPPTAFVYMPRDKHFASKENVEGVRRAVSASGSPTLVLTVQPRPFNQHTCFDKLPELGESTAACEALTKALSSPPVSLLDPHTYQVIKNPGSVDWGSAVSSLLHTDEGTASGDEFDAPPAQLAGKVPLRSHDGHSWVYSAVAEELAAAYAKHEMVSDHADRVLDWLCLQAGIQLPSSTQNANQLIADW